MTKDTDIAYRLRGRGIESAPVINGRIDPESWTLIDLDVLTEAEAAYVRVMRDAMIHSQRVD